MIEKSRLEELIKQGKPVYFIDMYKQIVQFKNVILNEYMIKLEIVNNMLYIVRKEDSYKPEIIYKLKFDEIFETKKDVEFALRYKHIPRTEYLDLPTWEEFKEIRFVEFFYQEYDYMLQYQNISNKIVVYERNNKGLCFLEETTKKNYIKACEVCRKLFLGGGKNESLDFKQKTQGKH